MTRDWGKEPWRRQYVNESIDDLGRPLLYRGLRDYLIRKARQDDGVLARHQPTPERAVETVVRACGAHPDEFDTCIKYMQLLIESPEAAAP